MSINLSAGDFFCAVQGRWALLFSTAGSLQDAWSIATGEVVDIERVAVRGSRHGGYRLQRYEQVYSGITEECTRYDFGSAEQRDSVPNRWLQAQQCLGVAACESGVTVR